MIVFQRGFVEQFVDEFEAGGRPEGHADRNGAIECDYR